MDYLVGEAMKHMAWPACFPVVNRISHACDVLRMRIASHQPSPRIISHFRVILSDE